MELNLRDKVVVITGGGSGIGRETAIEFAKEGVNVAVIGRNRNKLQSLKTIFRNNGWNLDYHSCDVRDKKALHNFSDYIFSKYGHIDIWMNNAGIAIDKPLMDFSDEDFDNLISTNLTAVYDGIRLAASYMISNNGGVILNASSFAAKIPHVNGVIYAATKAAVSNMTKSTAAALAPYGIRVIGYIPGMIATPMSKNSIANYEGAFIKNISLGRLGFSSDLSKPLVFLASDCAKYITGVDVEISGGKFAVQDCQMAWRIRNGDCR